MPGRTLCPGERRTPDCADKKPKKHSLSWVYPRKPEGGVHCYAVRLGRTRSRRMAFSKEK
jgi:hypothetical protein